MEKSRLSVCLVVQNEEKHLRRCLQSVADIAEEIIFVDTGSSDRTIEIARQFTDKVYSVKWRDNFSRARNYALGKATGEWILFLDGDEELTAESTGIIREKLFNNDCEGYLIKVLNYYVAANQVEIAPDVIFRIFRNKKEYRYSGAIHEQVCDNILAANPLAKIVIAEDICIIHYGYLTEEIAAKNKAERNTRLLLKAVKKDPNSLLDRFHLGVEFFRANQLDKALAEFLFAADKADMQAIYAPKLLRYITNCHYLMGNPDDALRFIDDVWMKLYPEQGDLYYLKGLICKDLGLHREAYKAFQDCLNVPAQPAHYANLYCQYKDKIFLQLGELYEYFCDKEKALEYYIKVVQETPCATRGLAEIIKILNPRENPEYSWKALNTVFDLSDPGIQLDLACLFFAERAYGLTIQCVDTASGRIELSPEACLIKGLSLLRTNRVQEAVLALNLIPPQNAAYMAAQGNLFLYHWLHDENQLMEVHLDNLKTSGLKPALAEVLELLQEDQWVTSDDLVNSISSISGEIVEVLEMLIETGGRSGIARAWNCFAGIFNNRPTRMLADLYYKYNVYDMALVEYRRLLDQGETAPETLYRLGKSCWFLGNLTEAETYMRKAMERGYNNPTVHRETARLYQEMAFKTLEEGIATYPNNEEMVELLQNLKDSLIEV